ncbi:hypothetical protein O6H91_13G086800 [Diphasiastrum complanatum]|nr:hypothetical protein O6H91_13G086800 [Diphasiastrum complanatum]
MRRPKAAQRPPATVFLTEPEGFRNLVQKLTGATMEQPMIPVSATASRPTNVRLQRIAPVPLRPISSHVQILPLSPRFPHPPSAITSEARAGASALSQKLSPNPVFSPLTFSPFPALTPNDSVWATGFESPASANMRQLAQLMVGNDSGGYKWDNMGGTSSSSQFILSPTVQNSFGHANQMGIDSGSSLVNAGMDMTNYFSSDFALDFGLPGTDF